jgi:exopolysaccharide biosynthesis protein
VGVDAANTRLIIVVVDGRRPAYSAGLTLGQLADEMIHLGCAEAINLDGGGSSTLVMRDVKSGKFSVVNRPSDGHDLRIPLSIERPVASALGAVIEPTR